LPKLPTGNIGLFQGYQMFYVLRQQFAGGIPAVIVDGCGPLFMEEQQYFARFAEMLAPFGISLAMPAVAPILPLLLH